MGNIEWAYLLLAVEGRINRAKFWIGLTVLYFVPWLFVVVALLADTAILYWFAFVVGLLAIWPAIAVSVKRWHDRGKSGWWILIGLVPLIGGIWALIETGFLPGTPGTNEYGPDPLAGV